MCIQTLLCKKANFDVLFCVAPVIFQLGESCADLWVTVHIWDAPNARNTFHQLKERTKLTTRGFNAVNGLQEQMRDTEVMY